MRLCRAAGGDARDRPTGAGRPASASRRARGVLRRPGARHRAGVQRARRRGRPASPSAVELLEATGVADARELLAPLVLQTAANWSERGAEALTGPIARGDEATVGRHLAALRESAPDLLHLYEALAERTRAIAEGRR